MGAVESVLGGTSYQVGSTRVTKVQQLAEGGFSFVDLVRADNVGGNGSGNGSGNGGASQAPQMYALKRLLCQSSEQLEAARAEIALHQAISHPFVLGLVDSAIVPAKHPPGAQEALLLFPLYKHGSIADVVQRFHAGAARAAAALASSPKSSAAAAQAQVWPFPEHEALRLFYACGQAVQALHQEGYAHRDVKPQNILLHVTSEDSYVAAAAGAAASITGFAAAAAAATPSTIEGMLNSEPTPVLIDLGSAMPIPFTPADRKEAAATQDRCAEHCTASYRAPELWEVRPGVTLDEKADVFSLALTLYFMAFGHSAFENEVEGVMTLAVRAGNVAFPEEAILPDGEDAGQAVTQLAAATTTAAHGAATKLPLHPSRQFSRAFAQLIRDMLHPDPAQRPSLRESMKRSVALMMRAVERAQAQTSAPHAASAASAAGASSVSSAAAVTAAPAAAPLAGDDEFGAFESATGSSSGGTAEDGPSLESLILEMQAGSSSSSAAAGSEGSGVAAAGVPGGFLKFGRKGAPHPTMLQLSADRRSLTYTSRSGLLGAPSIKTVPLSRISAVVSGQQTAKFARARTDPTYARRAHLCLSLLLRPHAEGASPSHSRSSPPLDEADPTSGEETLDLLADSHQLHRTWTTGLQRIIAQQQQQQQQRERPAGAEAVAAAAEEEGSVAPSLPPSSS